MLARWLRWLIAWQMGSGALLGLLLKAWLGVSAWWVLGLALAMPALVACASDVWTFTVSRARSEPIGAWWRALAGECMAGWRIFLLRQPWTYRPPDLQGPLAPSPAVPQAETRTATKSLGVVLVHGFICNHRIWDDLIQDLRSQGNTTLAVDLEPLLCSIDDYADSIEDAVQRLCAQTQLRQVVLIGHSMGGLAIRAWMRRYGHGRAARVVTLGTPHAGTRAKAPFTAANVAQMHWRSPWLQALGAQESAERRSLMQIALTPQDNIVYPQREQTLEGAKVTVFEGLGHLQLCTDPQVRAWVCAQAAA